MADDVVIVDYGSGNIRSILNAMKRSARDDQRVVVSSNASAIDNAERLVLPGVGAFAECRRKLEKSGLWPHVRAAVGEGRPLLGICVGMQVLADEGYEFYITQGLSLIPGVVRKLQPAGQENGIQKLPHVGWAPVEQSDCPLFDSIRFGESFYFVHSYVLDCVEKDDVAAVANYGETFTAAILRDNIFGCQFHPEKSDLAGLRIMKNFCRWVP